MECLFHYENIYWEIQKTSKRSFWKCATLSTEAPVGQTGGGWFTRNFEKQIIELIWAPIFFWIQFRLGAKSGGNL